MSSIFDPIETHIEEVSRALPITDEWLEEIGFKRTEIGSIPHLTFVVYKLRITAGSRPMEIQVHPYTIEGFKSRYFIHLYEIYDDGICEVGGDIGSIRSDVLHIIDWCNSQV